MPFSEADKEDIMTVVLIEMERMFTVLSNTFNVTDSDEKRYFDKIEKAIRASILNIE